MIRKWLSKKDSSNSDLKLGVKEERDRVRPRIFFIHIGKTAGISLEHILRQNYADTDICEHYYDTDFINNPEDLDYRLFLGHNWYYTIPILPADTTPITLLRDPIQRSLSAYEHILRDETHYYHKKVTDESSSPKDFLGNEHISKTFSNAQTRILGSDYDLKDLIARVASEKITKGEANSQIQTFRLNSQVDSAMLEKAKSRLSQMPAFGLTEEFSESARRIAETFGLVIDSIPHANSAPKGSKPRSSRYSTEDIDALKRLNEFDMELYDYAAKLFQERK